MFRYVVSGLAVESDLFFQGLVPQSPDEGPPDIVVRAGAVPKAIEGARTHGPNWTLAHGRFLIAIPGIVRMQLSEGRELLYEIESGVSADDAAIFLSGTGFGILLHQRGQILLHASAVRVGDGAVLFCGPSGAGKSTIAAALSQRGHDLLADDFCCISLTPSGSALVQPDCRQLKLWRNAIENLSLGERQTVRVRPQLQKYYVEPASSTRAALPLTAIYVLHEARPPHVPGIEAPNIVDGARLIRSNAYRPALVRRMGQESLYFQAAALFARQAQVFTLTRELGFDRMADGLDLLSHHWEKLGLRERAA